MDIRFSLSRDTVEQCHPTAPICLAPTATVKEALRQMREHNRGAVLVCRDSVVVGIFTERDALKMMAAGTTFDAPLAQFMTPDPVVLRATDTVGKAVSLMAQGGYRRLPIVDQQGRVTALIKVEGIMRYLVEHFPAVIYNLPPKPHHFAHDREGA